MDVFSEANLQGSAGLLVHRRTRGRGKLVLEMNSSFFGRLQIEFGEKKGMRETPAANYQHHHFLFNIGTA